MNILRSALLLLLLVVTPAMAQPIVGAEVLSNVVTPSASLHPMATPAVTMARDDRGVVIAWTMLNAQRVNAVYIARLDMAGRVVGAIREVPSSSTIADAAYPSIAASPTGSGFTVVWLEYSRAFPTVTVAFSHVTPDLETVGPYALLIAPQLVITRPPLARSGSATWIEAGGAVWRLVGDEYALRLPDVSTAGSDGTAGADPEFVSSERVTTGFRCAETPACAIPHAPLGTCSPECRIDEYTFSIRLAGPAGDFSAATYPFDLNAQPAIARRDDESLIAWFSGEDGGGVVAARVGSTSFIDAIAQAQFLGNFRGAPGYARPAIATDGDSFLVVWSTQSVAGADRDVLAAAIGPSGTVTSFSIATSDADERAPSVISTGNGTFLVAYESIANGERLLAGRVVSLLARRRAS
jgi:hypothetical protein